jgi:hypothetical protein
VVSVRGESEECSEGIGERGDGDSTVLYLEGECVNVVIDLYNVGNTAEYSAWRERRTEEVRDSEGCGGIASGG